MFPNTYVYFCLCIRISFPSLTMTGCRKGVTTPKLSLYPPPPLISTWNLYNDTGRMEWGNARSNPCNYLILLFKRHIYLKRKDVLNFLGSKAHKKILKNRTSYRITKRKNRLPPQEVEQVSHCGVNCTRLASHLGNYFPTGMEGRKGGGRFFRGEWHRT